MAAPGLDRGAAEVEEEEEAGSGRAPAGMPGALVNAVRARVAAAGAGADAAAAARAAASAERAAREPGAQDGAAALVAALLAVLGALVARGAAPAGVVERLAQRLGGESRAPSAAQAAAALCLALAQHRSHAPRRETFGALELCVERSAGAGYAGWVAAAAQASLLLAAADADGPGGSKELARAVARADQLGDGRAEAHLLRGRLCALTGDRLAALDALEQSLRELRAAWPAFTAGDGGGGAGSPAVRQWRATAHCVLASLAAVYDSLGRPGESARALQLLAELLDEGGTPAAAGWPGLLLGGDARADPAQRRADVGVALAVALLKDGRPEDAVVALDAAAGKGGATDASCEAVCARVAALLEQGAGREAAALCQGALSRLSHDDSERGAEQRAWLLLYLADAHAGCARLAEAIQALDGVEAAAARAAPGARGARDAALHACANKALVLLGTEGGAGRLDESTRLLERAWAELQRLQRQDRSAASSPLWWQVAHNLTALLLLGGHFARAAELWLPLRGLGASRQSLLLARARVSASRSSESDAHQRDSPLRGLPRADAAAMDLETLEALFPASA
jgi:hypothetical protein